ncbi:hypothetical protein OIU76_012041 [Salix suchowensis]|nr:hypothetical protein OIU76_012041 [Salix suchowensis]
MGKYGLFDLEKHFAFYVVLWLVRLGSLLPGSSCSWKLKKTGNNRPALIVSQMFPIGNISYFNSRCLLFQSNIARLEKRRTLDLNASLGLYLTLYATGDKEVVWNLDIGLCLYAVVGSFCWTIAVLVAQIICWTGQFIGHGVFEKRAPALLDNLVQAFVMAPFFVLLEALQTSFGYEPYPGFHASVQAKIGAQIKEWKENKKLKLHS